MQENCLSMVCIINSLLCQRSKVYNQSRLCVCVCLFVCQRSPWWTACPMDTEFGGGVDLDSAHFVILYGVMWCVTSQREVMTTREVTAWHYDIVLKLLSKNTDKEGDDAGGPSMLRRFQWISTCLLLNRLAPGHDHSCHLFHWHHSHHLHHYEDQYQLLQSWKNEPS